MFSTAFITGKLDNSGLEIVPFGCPLGMELLGTKT